MRTEWNRPHFKATGKGIFLSHYWPFVGAVVLTLVLSGNAVILQLNQWSNELMDFLWTMGVIPPPDWLVTLERYTGLFPSLSLGAALLFPVAEDQERDTSEEVSP